MIEKSEQKWEVISLHEESPFKIGEIFNQKEWDKHGFYISPNEYPKLFKKL